MEEVDPQKHAGLLGGVPQHRVVQDPNLPLAAGARDHAAAVPEAEWAGRVVGAFLLVPTWGSGVGAGTGWGRVWLGTLGEVLVLAREGGGAGAGNLSGLR